MDHLVALISGCYILKLAAESRENFRADIRGQLLFEHNEWSNDTMLTSVSVRHAYHRRIL